MKIANLLRAILIAGVASSMFRLGNNDWTKVSDLDFVLAWSSYMLLCSYYAGILVHAKGSPWWWGTLLGVLFGPLGILIALGYRQWGGSRRMAQAVGKQDNPP